MLFVSISTREHLTASLPFLSFHRFPSVTSVVLHPSGEALPFLTISLCYYPPYFMAAVICTVCECFISKDVYTGKEGVYYSYLSLCWNCNHFSHFGSSVPPQFIFLLLFSLQKNILTLVIIVQICSRLAGLSDVCITSQGKKICTEII